MALLCVAIVNNSSTTLEPQTISVICLNCTLGSTCPVCWVDADGIEVISDPSGRSTTSSSSASPDAATLCTTWAHNLS
eukprot:3737689-Prorocentrum_lima.AAC.1